MPVQSWALATSSSFRLIVVLMHMSVPDQYASVKLGVGGTYRRVAYRRVLNLAARLRGGGRRPAHPPTRRHVSLPPYAPCTACVSRVIESFASP
jgi:hypothetical protein